MIDTRQLIADFESCIGWPYASPGSNDERGIDCSGMFVRAYRLQKKSIYHGSNTIWRKHLREKGPIEDGTGLRPGMAVFKWKEKTPAKFRDNLGDFCHIGLVTAVNPLRIVHASTDGMCVRADTKLGKWRYWGILAEAEPLGAEAASPADCPLLRKGDTGVHVTRLQQRLQLLGYDLEADGIFGPVTRRCVKTFQRSCALEADGIVGPLTWAALEGEKDEEDERGGKNA